MASEEEPRQSDILVVVGFCAATFGATIGVIIELVFA